MKTATVHEFYSNVRLVDALAQGEQLVVTASGKPMFVVRKGARPRMTKNLAEARAVGDTKAPKFDGTRFLAALRK